MIIVPTHIHPDKIVLEVIFTPTEKSDPLFSTTRETLRTTKQTIKTVDTTLTITKTLTPTDNPSTVLGQLVDEVREKYCGDVTTPPIKSVDSKTNEIIYETKDLTNNPQFTLGLVEPVKETIEIIDEPIKPITETIKKG